MLRNVFELTVQSDHVAQATVWVGPWAQSMRQLQM